MVLRFDLESQITEGRYVERQMVEFHLGKDVLPHSRPRLFGGLVLPKVKRHQLKLN
jgi:hypothetical protein